MINISSEVGKREKDVVRIQTRKSDVDSINLLRPWTSINPTNPTYPATNQPNQTPPNLQNVKCNQLCCEKTHAEEDAVDTKKTTKKNHSTQPYLEVQDTGCNWLHVGL